MIYTSDHGENLFEHGLLKKHTLLDASLRIPLILRAPGIVPAGRTADGLIENIDLLPTAFGLIGQPLPADQPIEGRDFSAAVRGDAETGDLRDEVKAEFYQTLDPCRMLRTRRWKHVHTEGDVDELYDLGADPLERNNLAWSPGHAERFERMNARVLADWEIPDTPDHGAWRDLTERKQLQLRRGDPIAGFGEA